MGPNCYSCTVSIIGELLQTSFYIHYIQMVYLFLLVLFFASEKAKPIEMGDDASNYCTYLFVKAQNNVYPRYGKTCG